MVCLWQNMYMSLELIQLHDTHVHLDMLLAKLNFLPDGRVLEGFGNEEFEFELSKTALSDSAARKLESLIIDHEFLCHSTCSTKNFLVCHRLFSSFDKVKYFLGSHPDIVDDKFELESYLDFQTKMINKYEIKNKIIGVGEIGLDYFHCKDRLLQDIQKKLFESQIQLAINLDLPIMIHCREAFEDLFEILERYPQIHGRFLIHCFTAGVDEMYKIVQLNGKMAFGGVSTFKSAIDLHQAIIECPLECFVLETDLPFLAPVRGQICLPAMIDIIAQRVADLKNLTKEEIWQLSRENTLELFTKIKN
jgi:TatD DNase family protein